MTSRIGAILAALLTFGPLQAADRHATGPTVYDIVIRNGRGLDGDGNPWVRADIAIQDGRFVKIGRVEGHAKREIDAQGEPGVARFILPGSLVTPTVGIPFDSPATAFQNASQDERGLQAS